jgi:hypothetical protein
MENNETQKETGIKERILGKIDANELTMRPKTYFTLKVGVLIAVAFCVLTISVLICNFIVFSIRINGHDALLHFGSRGFLVFLTFFPWTLLLLDIVFIVLLEWLVRHFRFGYLSPVLYLFFGFFVMIISTGLFIDRVTDFNDELLSRARAHRLQQPFGNLYERARAIPPAGSGVYRGVVTGIFGNTITLYNMDIGTTSILTVIVPSDDLYATSSFHVGETIFIAGDAYDGTIHAFGVRKITR